jgi:HAD superfamily hydrolase (TIGR01509 family)
MPSTIKFIYFDIGGVLVDWLGAFYSVAKKCNKERQAFVKIFTSVDDDITKGIITPQDLWLLCQSKLRITDNKKYDFLDSWTNDYFPIKKTHHLVNKLTKNYQIGLLSNIYKGMTNQLIQKQLIPNIDYTQIILSCNLGTKKPEEKIYKIAQEKIKVKPNEILFIDDNEGNFLPAKKLGWNCFRFNFRNPQESVKELETKLL